MNMNNMNGNNPLDLLKNLNNSLPNSNGNNI